MIAFILLPLAAAPEADDAAAIDRSAAALVETGPVTYDYTVEYYGQQASGRLRHDGTRTLINVGEQDRYLFTGTKWRSRTGGAGGKPPLVVENEREPKVFLFFDPREAFGQRLPGGDSVTAALKLPTRTTERRGAAIVAVVTDVNSFTPRLEVHAEAAAPHRITRIARFPYAPKEPAKSRWLSLDEYAVKDGRHYPAKVAIGYTGYGNDAKQKGTITIANLKWSADISDADFVTADEVAKSRRHDEAAGTWTLPPQSSKKQDQQAGESAEQALAKLAEAKRLEADARPSPPWWPQALAWAAGVAVLAVGVALWRRREA